MAIKIIAEAGVNHNGDKDLAFRLIEGAQRAGADYVKFQTFSADRLAKASAPKASYQRQSTDVEESQQEMLKKLELPLEWHAELKNYANSLGIEFLSTAFDIRSLKFLDKLEVPFFKVPSGEITNSPLLWEFAATQKELVISTGMANLAEIEFALAVVAHSYAHPEHPVSNDEIWQFWSQADAFEKILNKVTLLHCTSQYPTSLSEANLQAIAHLENVFGLPVGYSDHTSGTSAPAAAAALGAEVLEKHFTLDRNLPGPDHRASIEVEEFTAMVSQIREIETALGNGRKVPQSSEWDTRSAARQSLVALKDIMPGEKYSAENIGTARVGAGTSPSHYWDFIGRKASQKILAGEKIK